MSASRHFRVVARVPTMEWERQQGPWKESRKEFSTPAAVLKYLEDLDKDAEVISIDEIYTEERVVLKEQLLEMVKNKQ
jgi:hypothetical protein